VMNMKARKVRQATIDEIGSHVPPEDLFVTRTVEQSDECLVDIVQKRYPLVFCGGGDGTAMRIIEQLIRHVKRLNAEGGDFVVPKVGLLKLGTGNGWAGMVKSPKNVEPIEFIKSGGQPGFAPFHLIRTGDRLAHMGGIGADAAVLNDYIQFKNKYPSGFMWKVANSVFGYFFAAFTRTIPRFARGVGRIEVRVFSDSDDPVFRVSHSRGVEETTLKKGDVIYEGTALIVMFGTTDNYGFNLRAFPFSTVKPGFMHLRIIETSIPRILINLPSNWKGTWEHPTMSHFLARRIRIESKADVPFQLGGDPEGYRTAINLEVTDETIDVMDFR